MEDNYGAVLLKMARKPFSVEETDARYPDENEIVVRNAAVSINPVDAAMQAGYVANLTVPGILGVDVAGEVVEVGSQATSFSVGDRVMGHALRLATDDDRHAAFQNYTVLWRNMASPIPPSLSYEDACTMPLGVSTASAALFQRDMLGLEPPVLYPSSRDEWVIVAGSTGNVGSHGVRLACAAGYNVLVTASSKSFGLAKSLGATDVVDYNDKDLVNTLAEKLSGKTVVGAFDASGQGPSIITMARVLAKCDGNRTVAAVVDDYAREDVPKGVTVKLVLAIAIRDTDVSKRVWEDFLPDALATGRYPVFPEGRVVGSGLGSIQAAMDDEEDKKTKSPAGQKAVVTLA